MRPRGQTLLLAILVVATLTSLGLTAVVSVLANRTVVRTAKERALARNIAEAGIEKALYEINKSASYSGDPATAFGSGYFTTTVTAVGNNKQIDSVGYYPTVANFRAKRTLRVIGAISTSKIAFNYGVQVGIGGLTMDNNSTVNGNVYTGGSAVGNPGSGTTVNGSIFVSVGAVQDEQNTTPSPVDQALGNSASIQAIAESFKPGATDRITQVALLLKKIGVPGSPTAAFVHIYSDDSGSPSSAELARGILGASFVTGSYYWVTVPLRPPCAFDLPPCTGTDLPTLTQNTTYWLALDSGSTTATDYWLWGRDSNQGYGNGVGKSWDGSTWTMITGDMNFRTYKAASTTKLQDINNINKTCSNNTTLACTQDSDCGSGNTCGGGDVHACTISGPSGYAIGGDAYYGTSPACTFSGYTSLPSGRKHANSVDAVIQSLPISDGNIADWETQATAGGVGPGKTITANGSLGPEEIDGDLLIQNGLTITLKGPVWVRGDVTLQSGSNASVLKLDPAFSFASTVLIADDPANPNSKGKLFVGNKWNVTGSGVSGSYILMLSKFSGNPPNNAIDVNNNASGAIFFAPYGQVNISNNVSLKEVTAYLLHLNQGSTVTYDSGLANAQFTTGPGASWRLLKDSWQELKP